MTTLDASIVIVALPTIGRSLHTGTAQLQWVVSGYALAFSVVPIVGGRLGDDLGRRRVLLLSTAGFLIASAAVALAPTPLAIDVSRVAQGLAGGLINPQISGIIQQLFPRRDRGVAFSMVGVSNSIAIACGPVLAGGIILLGGPHLGWRLLFFLNLPIGIASLLGCSRLLAPDARRMRRRRLDLVGLTLLAAAVSCVVFPAVQFDSNHDSRLLLLLVPAAAFSAGLLAWERRLHRAGGWPLLDLDLFRIRSFSLGLRIGMLYFAAFGVAPLVLALYLQDGLGYSAGRSGLIAGAYALGSVVSAPVGGRLVRRLGRRLTLGALGVFGLGFLGLIAVVASSFGIAATTVGLVLLVPLVVAGLGGGCVSNPNQALTFADVDVRSGSTAGGMLQTAQRVGQAIGTGVVSAVFYALVAQSPSSGTTRRADYAHAYMASIGAAVLFVLGAMWFAWLDLRRTDAGA
jgi:EmrB/QacA subfamily drug resistance transporter